MANGKIGMTMFRRFIAALILLVPLGVGAVTFPTPQGYVNDFANIVSEPVEVQLEQELGAYEQESQHEVAVVTVASLEDMEPSQYAIELGERWGVGKKQADNGVVILVAPNDRATFIATGRGLEGAIPDIIAVQITTLVMDPYFKKGDFDTGIINGVHAVQEAARGELVLPETKALGLDVVGLIAVGASMILFGALIILFVLDNRKRHWPAGVVGGLMGGFNSLAFLDVLGPFRTGAIILAFAIGGYAFGKWLGSKDVHPGKFKGWGSSGGGWRGGSSGGGHSFGGGSFGGGGGGSRW